MVYCFLLPSPQVMLINTKKDKHLHTYTVIQHLQPTIISDIHKKRPQRLSTLILVTYAFIFRILGRCCVSQGIVYLRKNLLYVYSDAWVRASMQIIPSRSLHGYPQRCSHSRTPVANRARDAPRATSCVPVCFSSPTTA